MKHTLTVLAFAFGGLASAVSGGEIDLRIGGFSADEGVARIVLMEGIEGYTSQRPVTLTASVPIVDGQAHWRADLPNGTYAIIAHHDRNANDELDRPVFELPLEPYGYSNGAWTSLGLPTFQEVAFDIGDGVTRQSIRLRTNAFFTFVQVAAAAIAAMAALFGALALYRRSQRLATI